MFTNNFIDVDILSMSAISQVVEHWLFSINVSICLLSTSTHLPDHGTVSSEKFPAWNFLNHFWQVWSVTEPSLTLCKSFCVCVCFSYIFTFLEIIKHNTSKCHSFSSIFNIKVAMKKFTNFDNFLKKSMLIWQLPQYNLTKLFWMKLKTTKCYESHLTEKPNKLFGQPNTMVSKRNHK